MDGYFNGIYSEDVKIKCFCIKESISKVSDVDENEKMHPPSIPTMHNRESKLL